MASLQNLAKLARTAGWDVLSAMLGDILAELKKESPTFFANRIKQSIAEGRDELAKFLVEGPPNGLLDGTADAEAASAALRGHQRLWQESRPRPYGAGEPYEPMTENSKANSLTKLFQAFNPPKEMPFPELRTGTGSTRVNEEILRDYNRRQKACDREARARAKARIASFKRIGLMSFEERDAFLEIVNDDTLNQFLIWIGFEVGKGAKKLDAAATRAARPNGRLDQLVTRLENYAYGAEVVEEEVVHEDEDDPVPLELEEGAH